MDANELNQKFEFELAMQMDFEVAVKNGHFPFLERLHWFTDRNDLLPIEVAEAVYGLAPSAVVIGIEWQD